MNYKGVIIEESLANKDVLKDVVILNTKVEPITPEHKTPHLKQLTLYTVEIPEEKADEIVEKLAKYLETEHTNWYADFKNDKYHYIIYSGGKVFKVDLSNPTLYKEAKAHGISLGIPDYQVDFAPDDKVWER